LAAPAALDEVAARQPVVEPVAVEPVPPAPVAVEPVATAPPATVASGPAFTPTSVGGALNGAPAVPAARATLPAGPRLARVGPGRTPGPAIF
jgi:hypothetical protein